MSRRFLTHTIYEESEKQMQKVPGFDRIKLHNKFLRKYHCMLRSVLEKYELQSVLNRMEDILLAREYKNVLFKDSEHKSRFLQSCRAVKQENWAIGSNKKYLAIIYLLSSEEYFWKDFGKMLHPEWIDLTVFQLRNVKEELYNIYQAARYLEAETLLAELQDWTEPGVIQDNVLLLIMNALIAREYGIGAFTLRIKEI